MSHFHRTAERVRFSDEKMQKINLHESAKMFCDVYCLQPGQAQSAHDHAGEDKVYHCLSGRVMALIGDVEREILPGDVAIAPAGVIHGVRNASDENATLLVFMAPHPRWKG